MAQFTLSLVVVVLSVLVSTQAGGRWNQLGGGRPGFGQVESGDGKCSALDSILPNPKSGCCGKHAENDGGSLNDNNGGGDQGDDFGDSNGAGIGDGYGPGGDGDLGYGPGEDNDLDYGPGDDGDLGYEPGDDTDFRFRPGGNGDFDNGFNKGNDFDFGDDDFDGTNEWGAGGNGIGDFDFAPWQFNDENRYKRSADNNNSDVAPDKFITAGKPAGISQFPWLVHLTVKIQEMLETKMIGCGGSLISSRHVITAAHCVDFDISSHQDVSVYLAEYNKRTYPDDCVGRHCVKNIIMHPDRILKHRRYQRGALHNDIALMRLSGLAPYTGYIRPICLPPFNINTAKYEGTPLTVTGWGQTEYGQPSSVKLYTRVLQVAPNRCRRHYPDITEGQLCAAGKRGQDTCMGDSGSPIMMERDGTFYIVGLVSGKRSDAGCGSPVPTMYTNVFFYTRWIQDFMRS